MNIKVQHLRAGTRLTSVQTSSGMGGAGTVNAVSSRTAVRSGGPAPSPAASEGINAYDASYMYDDQSMEAAYAAMLESIEQKRQIAISIKAQREIDARVPPLDAYLKHVTSDPTLQNVADPLEIAIKRRCEEWKYVREEMRREWSMPHLLFAEPIFAWAFFPTIDAWD